MSLVFDFGRVQKFVELPNGNIRAAVRMAEASKDYVYLNRDGTKRIEQILQDDLYSGTSINSLRGGTLTNDHPSVPVTTKNYRKYAVGQLSDAIVTWDDDPFLTGFIDVKDEETIKAIKAGKRQLSPGYTRDLAALDGKLYQKNRFYNHLALVDMARGGFDCRIKDATDKEQLLIDAEDLAIFDPSQIDQQLIDYWSADSPENSTNAINRLLLHGELNPKPIVIPKPTVTYSKITIDGVSLEINPDSTDAAMQLATKITQMQTVVDAAATTNTESIGLAAQLAAATAKNSELQTQLDAAATQVADGVSQAIKALGSAQGEIEIFKRAKVDIAPAKVCLDANDIDGYKAAIVTAITKKAPTSLAVEYQANLDAYSMAFAGGMGNFSTSSMQSQELAAMMGGSNMNGMAMAKQAIGAENPTSLATIEGKRMGGTSGGIPPMDGDWV
jgi:hypothetical protein